MTVIDDFKDMSDFQVTVKGNSISIEDTISENIKAGANMVLYGPPGTGKTHTVLSQINLLKEQNIVGEILIIQFHPQYTYQDFIEGYTFDGSSFQYKPGVLLKFCDSDQVKNNEDKLHILYIDEINRADLASVFGELLYLLDRDESKKVILPLKGREFSLPKNILIIGSMNSADKSISLIDYALRRRFDFIFVPPSLAGFNKIIETKKLDDTFDIKKYSRFFQVLNSRILRHPLLGKNMTLGHSMFFSKQENISNESIYKAITSGVLTQIESYLGAENFPEISQILSPHIAKNIMYGKSSSLEEIMNLIDIVASSEEEVLF